MKYEAPETEPQMAKEPTVACAVTSQPVMHVNLSYDVPKKIDIITFRTMMDEYASALIHQNEITKTIATLRSRLILAADDARDGRTVSCEEVHANLEQKFPWLCD